MNEYKHNNVPYESYSDSLLPSIVKTVCSLLNTSGGSISFIEDSKNADNVFKSLYTAFKEKIHLKSNEKKTVLNHDDFFKKAIKGKRIILSIISVYPNGYAFIKNKRTNENEVYVRVKYSNIKTNEEQASYWRLVALHDFPIIKEYEPSDSKEKRRLSELKEKNNVKFKVVGSLPRGKDYFYKYMDLESAILSLSFTKGDKNHKNKKTSLRFVEPSYWEDQYEGKFYNAIFDNCSIDALRAPFLFACCFSSKRENEAAWILYSHNKTGLASRCVEFTLSRSRLREQLVKNLKNCTIYIGSVDYKSKSYIDSVNMPKIGDSQKDNEVYFNYFKGFSIERYINLLLLKRSAFEHEQEVRIFVIPDSKRSQNKSRRSPKGKLIKKAKPMYIPIDWLDVIKEIKIDKKCTEFEKKLLKERLRLLLAIKMDRIRKENAGKMTDEAINDIEENFNKMIKHIKVFDPYEDESLDKGPLCIKTI